LASGTSIGGVYLQIGPNPALPFTGVATLLPKYEPAMCIELVAQVIVRVQGVVVLLHHG